MKALAGLPKPDVRNRALDELAQFTNPFRIGDVLCVEFGTRQQMRVVGLRYNACLLALPGGYGNIWRGVDVLLRLNPDHARIPLLPAPRHRYVRVGEQQLSPGDSRRDEAGPD